MDVALQYVSGGTDIPMQRLPPEPLVVHEKGGELAWQDLAARGSDGRTAGASEDVPAAW